MFLVSPNNSCKTGVLLIIVIVNIAFRCFSQASSEMGSLLFLTVAVVSALCGLSQSCSPCPFEWMENRNYCYRYFPENLSYDEADMFCKQFSHTGHVAELATVTSLEELTLFMDYLDKVFVNVPSEEAPKKVWLRNNTKKRPGRCTQFRT